MTVYLQQFYSNWLGKADTYTENTLANHFDKFSSLYVVFNALYMDIMSELVISGHQMPKDFKEKKAASDYVLQFLKSKYLIENLLNTEESQNDLAQICRIIEEERIHIILEWGNQQRESDLKLLASLRSNSKQEKGKAILLLLYHIRCNLFHGHKAFEERQRNFLVPLNRLLRKVVVLTYNKLPKEE